MSGGLAAGSGSLRRPLRVMTCAGTRPEAIKLAPVVRALRRAEDIASCFVHTGQHAALFEDGIQSDVAPDLTLCQGIERVGTDAQAERISAAMVPLLREHAPDLVIVQGDTTSAWAVAKIAQRLTIPVAHVEAGLRSGDPVCPWPEERNRFDIGQIACLNFAPTAAAAANLHAEGVRGQIHITGNTGIDALLHTRSQVTPLIREDGRKHIVVTCHRRENVGAGVDRIAAALKMLVQRRYDCAATVYLHTNPAGMRLRELLAEVRGVTLAEPVDYVRMVAILAGAYLVISDSGGLQEECPTLGVPLLVLREVTERPEAIATGRALLVGTGIHEIVSAADRILDDAAVHAAMAKPAFPFGDGTAAAKIVGIIAAYPFARG